ncbi:ssDNA endonuclease and repair protein rad10 [Extremus antarcticus]|uniref:SsDNA endonuclease and repair protein rad10 n=1 Tax=Extremus antarcticus TaxID=702011 RepID=A0AAJ0GF31_9PEZI|nr:ssDNA endonuclease and repair protein rad10 [Extremus antarcticus]
MDNDPIQELPTRGQPSAGPRTTINPDRTSATTTSSKPGVVQPKPQSLPKRSGPASIIVSPRQKGNRILELIRSVPWEYGDIVADYVLGVTTCALFLSLKYHRLHPEYVYTRIRNLQGKYALRVVLVLVDIPNHEDPLKELSKTSLINNVTLVLCWSAAEGARYLELFKSYENAAPTAIKQHQNRMVDFITTPRSINKTDAVALVSQFGSVRTAVNARHEDVSGIAGWGEKKVQRWCAAVREPFRIQRAAKRGLGREQSSVQSRPISMSRGGTRGEGGSPAPLGIEGLGIGDSDADRRPSTRIAEEVDLVEDDGGGEAAAEQVETEAVAAAPVVRPKDVTDNQEEPPAKMRKPNDDAVSDGVMAALSKLRK